MSRPVYIIGAASTPFGRHEQTPIQDLAAGVAEQAIDQARLAESDRDGPTGGRSRSRTSAGHSMRPHVTRNPRAESAYLSEVM